MLDLMRFQTTEEAAKGILRILEEEAQALAIEPNIERQKRKNQASEAMVSLKKNGETFRITVHCVRDHNIGGFLLGHGYIEKAWDLALRPERQHAIPVAPPFVWKLRPHDSTPQTPYTTIMTEDWLRQQIRKKLAITQ